MKESELITPIVRTKLVDDENKPCAYFGMMQGKRVFVKGPFATQEEGKLKLRDRKAETENVPRILQRFNTRLKNWSPDALK